METHLHAFAAGASDIVAPPQQILPIGSTAVNASADDTAVAAAAAVAHVNSFSGPSFFAVSGRAAVAASRRVGQESTTCRPR